MMKHNGFTLIELLAAIIVIGIISLIVFPTVNKTLKDQRQRLYNRQVATIEEAAESWALKNTDKLPIDDSMVYISITDLISAGLLENADIKDPRNGSDMSTGCVMISLSSNQYSYKYQASSCPAI